MKLNSDSFPDGGRIPPKFAFGKQDPETHVTFSENRNPHLRWSEVPEGTRSFALICHDPDAPPNGGDVNQEGRTVPHDFSPRSDFFHWVLVDIPADVREIPEGTVSREVTPRGKPVGSTALGRTGRNDYTDWFSGDENLDGVYGGYDGPGPPWNDERVHRYVFNLYALDTDSLDLPSSFGGDDVRRAIEGHVLGRAEYTGTYTLNPAVAEG